MSIAFFERVSIWAPKTWAIEAGRYVPGSRARHGFGKGLVELALLRCRAWHPASGGLPASACSVEPVTALAAVRGEGGSCPGRRAQMPDTPTHLHHGPWGSFSVGRAGPSNAASEAALRTASTTVCRLTMRVPERTQAMPGRSARARSSPGNQRPGSATSAACAPGGRTSVGVRSEGASSVTMGRSVLGRPLPVLNSRRSDSGGSRSADSARIARPASRCRSRRVSAGGCAVIQSPGTGCASVRKGSPGAALWSLDAHHSAAKVLVSPTVPSGPRRRSSIRSGLARRALPSRNARSISRAAARIRWALTRPTRRATVRTVAIHRPTLSSPQAPPALPGAPVPMRAPSEWWRCCPSDP